MTVCITKRPTTFSISDSSSAITAPSSAFFPILPDFDKNKNAPAATAAKITAPPMMSGSFVQRGEPAIISKFKRAEMAIKCGADLVVELPLPYSVATANRFAFGGVNILQYFVKSLWIKMEK
mgnify:CR=1 FL=1